MQGYITKKGLLFTTNLRVVEKLADTLALDGNACSTLELDPKVVAEPGDMICIEGDLLYNLTRAAYSDPRVVHYVSDTMFVEVRVS